MRYSRIRVLLCGAALSLVLILGNRLAGGGADVNPPKEPLGLPPVYWPDENEYTPAKRELGWLLYFDKRLSSDGSVSCASCHSPDKAFTDGAPVSTGIKGQKGGRSAPTVINRAYSLSQFWDGRAATPEDQAKGPIANAIEMTNEGDASAAHRACVQRLKAVPGYVARFEKVFGVKDFNIDHVAMAIATFERTVLSGNSPFDKYKAGDKKALSETQIRGMGVFFDKAQCDRCHFGFNFTDGSFENIGIGMDKPNPDLGRFLVTKNPEHKGAFKTPTLREIEHTAPYMHDGSLKTLLDVVEHYDKGGIPNANLSKQMKKLNLTPGDKSDLVAFLKALSGEGWQHIRAPEAKELPR